ncbi:DUF3347 domain-containing protein [Pontibacter locisalis]|uniref:DUF3347 domain-containing protein n=1 Tax=Pontibacter locisalis TaxID=1719035 RepID=A0ABW5IFE0_9BACT
MKLNRYSFSVLVLLTSMLFCNSCQEQRNKENVSDPPNPANVAGYVTDSTSLYDQVAIETILQTDTMQFRDQTTEAFKEAFEQALINYLQLQEALAQNDLAKADQFASEMLGSLRATDVNDLQEEAKAFWAEKKLFLEEHLRMQREMEDMQRIKENFIYISTAMIKAVNAFGSSSELYVMYCPLVNERRGAYWLSKTNEVRNPYGADAFLECGEVKKILR